MTGPVKVTIAWKAAAGSDGAHLPLELRARTASSRSTDFPEPTIPAYVPVPPVIL